MKFIRTNYKKSGKVAKNRLKLLLVSDRACCSPEMMDQLKGDLIQVISKYMDIEQMGVQIQITQEKNDIGVLHPMLFANVPIRAIHNSYTGD